MKLDIKAGDKFNRLTILEEVEKHIYPSGETRRRFLAQCDCGSKPKAYLINQLTSGKTKSCGCLNIENITKHGMNQSRAYQCWADMKVRCDNPSHASYPAYGGRGISYCNKWKTFEGFWEDMKEAYQDDLTLNRRDNDGDYCKENCSWDTKHFQGHMRRKLEGTLLKSIGMTYDKKAMKYRVRMKILEEPYSFGSYETEEDAAKAYDDASELYYGDRPNKTAKSDDWIFAQVQKYMDNRDSDLRKLKLFNNPCNSQNSML